jgi:hypothetical protein
LNTTSAVARFYWISTRQKQELHPLRPDVDFLSRI